MPLRSLGSRPWPVRRLMVIAQRVVIWAVIAAVAVVVVMFVVHVTVLS